MPQTPDAPPVTCDYLRFDFNLLEPRSHHAPPPRPGACIISSRPLPAVVASALRLARPARAAPDMTSRRSGPRRRKWPRPLKSDTRPEATERALSCHCGDDLRTPRPRAPTIHKPPAPG